MQVFVIMYMLHQIIGLVPALAGVAAMVLVAPLNMLLGSLVHRYRLDLIGKTDARVKIMSEVINGTHHAHACHGSPSPCSTLTTGAVAADGARITGPDCFRCCSMFAPGLVFVPPYIALAVRCDSTLPSQPVCYQARQGAEDVSGVAVKGCTR